MNKTPAPSILPRKKQRQLSKICGVTKSKHKTLTAPSRTFAITPNPRRNQPRNAKANQTAFSNPTNTNKTFVNELQSELSQINSQSHQLPNLEDVTSATSNGHIIEEIHPDTPLTMEQVSRIFGHKTKLNLPNIPLTGSQAYWATVTDPNNPFTFPVLNLESLLAPTDISVSIQSKDSDVSADKLFQDYKTMMASTIQQSGPSGQQSGKDSSGNPSADDKFEQSLHKIANPQINNPFAHLARPPVTADDADLSMSTSRVNFNQTVVIMTPIRKSQLEGIKKVFKVVTQNEREAKTVNEIVTQNDPNDSNPLSNLLVLAKAEQSNKRFDVLLSRAKKNKPQMDISSLFNENGDADQPDEDQDSKTALIFSSNISHQSLTMTKQRLDAQNEEYTQRLQAQKKIYTPPFQEHVCLERNFILELERDPSLVTFPYSHKDPIKSDPITHILAFPVKSSTTTYATNDPLGDPSNDPHYRIAEAEFLIQCGLMGQNFPAPIDPKFTPLMDQDAGLELTPEESQQSREAIGRSIIAMYGHGSGLASKPWSSRHSLVKNDIYKQIVATPTNPKEERINYELDITYTHNPFYRTLYNFSLLPTENEVQANLTQLHSQLKSMAGFDESILSSIRNHTSDAFDENSNPNTSDQLTNAMDKQLTAHNITNEQLNFSEMTPESIEHELEKRMRQIDQRQYMFQQQIEDQMCMDTVQRIRQQQSQSTQFTSKFGVKRPIQHQFNDKYIETEFQHEENVIEAEVISKETIANKQ